MARMTWDPDAGAIYIYGMEGYEGPVVTGSLFEDEFSVNVDRTPDRHLIGMEVYGIDRLENLSPKFRLYLTPQDIKAAKEALRGPMDTYEAVMMACGEAVLAVMEGGELVFPRLESATPSTETTASGSSPTPRPRSPGARSR